MGRLSRTFANFAGFCRTNRLVLGLRRQKLPQKDRATSRDTVSYFIYSSKSEEIVPVIAKAEAKIFEEIFKV